MTNSGSVFHLFHSTGVGGIEIHILQLAVAQQSRGWTTRILTRPDSWLARHAIAEGLEVIPLRMCGFFDVLSAVRLVRLIRHHRPHLLHAHGMRSSHYARLARLWCASPKLVMTAHSTNSWKHFDRSAPIICVSRAVKAALSARGLFNLQLIYNGISELAPPADRSIEESPLYREIAESKRIEGRLVLLQVGRFIRDKGQDWLLEQLATLPRDLAGRVLVLFAGNWQETAYGRACQLELLTCPRLKNMAVFLGYQSPGALTAWYRLADALVLPSRREAFSLSLLEAARAGIPALATEVGGVPELVGDKGNGYLFPPEDGQVFTDRLRFLLNPAARHALGDAARTRFLKSFTVERMAHQTLALYRQVLAGEAQADVRNA